MNIIIVHLLLRPERPRLTGSNPHEEPITRGSDPPSLMWDHWTSVLLTHARRKPLEKTGTGLWTQLRSRTCRDESSRMPWAPHRWTFPKLVMW